MKILQKSLPAQTDLIIYFVRQIELIQWKRMSESSGKDTWYYFAYLWSVAQCWLPRETLNERIDMTVRLVSACVTRKSESFPNLLPVVSSNSLLPPFSFPFSCYSLPTSTQFDQLPRSGGLGQGAEARKRPIASFAGRAEKSSFHLILSCPVATTSDPEPGVVPAKRSGSHARCPPSFIWITFLRFAGLEAAWCKICFVCRPPNPNT